MLTVGIHAFVIALWAGVFWGSIKLVDRFNAKNTIGLSLALAAIFDFSHAFGVPDVYHGIAWLVFLWRLLSWHHNLSLLQTLIVVLSTLFSPYFLVSRLASWIGDSELRGGLVLYGVPAIVFGAFAYSWFQERRGRPVPVGRELPAARVEKIGDKTPREQTAPVVAPPRVVAPPPRPPTNPPRGPDEGPSFLS